MNCPSCEALDSVTTSIHAEDFRYVHNGVEKMLAIKIPVRTCSACDFSFTDGETELIHEAARRTLRTAPKPKLNVLVEMALQLARERHHLQVDKQGKPYISHLMRVAARVADDEICMCVALLHDILEDTDTEAGELYAFGFDEEIVEAVILLTKDTSITYHENIAKIKLNAVARRVKIADLEDNLDPSRALPAHLDWMRDRYREALETLRAMS